MTEGIRQASMTQAELAEKIGTNKSYISRIEKGQIEPGVSTFLRINDALGLRFEIVKPMTYALQPQKVRTYLSDVDTPDLCTHFGTQEKLTIFARKQKIWYL